MEKFLQGKTCLVSGGAQGIGWAISQAIADFGGNVFVCDISPDNLEKAREQAKAQGWESSFHFSVCDVGKRAQVEEWVQQAYTQTGRLDVLVNNAAFYRWKPVDELDVEVFERTMQTGYLGAVYAIKAVLPVMRAQGSGHIVTMGSSAGKLFIADGITAYGPSKAALGALSESLNTELAGTGIYATLVRPGVVAGTEFFGKHVNSFDLPRLGDFLPALTPDKVADAIVKALRHPRARLDLPAYLPPMYVMFEFAPNFLRWITTLGGKARTDYSHTPWKYRPRV